MTLLQRVNLLNQAFAKICAESNLVRRDLDRFSAWFGEVLLRKRF
jgi:hypothetical protein